MYRNVEGAVVHSDNGENQESSLALLVNVRVNHKHGSDVLRQAKRIEAGKPKSQSKQGGKASDSVVLLLSLVPS